MTEYDTDHRPLKLGLGFSLLKSSHLTGLLTILLGIPVLMIILLLYAQLPEADAGDGSKLLAGLQRLMEKDPDLKYDLWLMAALLPLLVIVYAGHRAASLQITSAGLQAFIPKWLLMGLFGQTSGRWHIFWENIQRAHLVEQGVMPPGAGRILQHLRKLNTTRLILETDQGDIRIHPFQWFDRSGRDHRLGLGEAFLRGRFDPEEVLQRAPLMRALAARGFEVGATEEEQARETPEPAGFDLSKHKGMLTQVALLFIAGTYAVLDTYVFSHYRPLETLPVMPFVAVAAVSGLIVTKLGSGAPKLERRCVGVLTVAALVAAVYPAMLRINAVTAEARVVTYEAMETGQFETDNNRPPAIDLSGENLDEYMEQYPPGTRHEFTIQRGVGGFTQVNLSPFYTQTREFYRNYREAADE